MTCLMSYTFFWIHERISASLSTILTVYLYLIVYISTFDCVCTDNLVVELTVTVQFYCHDVALPH